MRIPATPQLTLVQHRTLGAIVLVGVLVIAALAVLGIIVERQARTPLITVGQAAPEWQLPLANGGTTTLAAQRGKIVVLAFVPAMNCASCRQQLTTLQAALPELATHGAVVFAISTDLSSVQRAFARQLGLSFGLLSEAPITGFHPVASAYGLYHRADGNNGPVTTNAIVIIDHVGIVRAVALQPNAPIEREHILALVDLAQP